MAEFNTPLAVKVLASIEESLAWDDWKGPTWNQSRWGVIYNEDRIPEEASEDGRGTRLLDAIVDVDDNLVGWGTCGTAMCFAGWALSHEKVKISWVQFDRSGQFHGDMTSDGEEVPEVAMERLGISRPTCDDGEGCYCGECGDCALWDHSDGMPRLFSARNTLADIYSIISDHSGLSETELREMVQTQVNADRRRYEALLVK